MAAQMKALEQDYEAMKEKFDAAKARYLVVHMNDFYCSHSGSDTINVIFFI